MKCFVMFKICYAPKGIQREKGRKIPQILAILSRIINIVFQFFK